MKNYWVYILTNKTNTVLYIGVTDDIARRVEQHGTGAVDSFTKRYNLYKLVYLEKYDDLLQAREREKRLKKWNRQWKIELIESVNPAFNDLSLNSEYFNC